MNTCNSYYINVSYQEKCYRIHSIWNDYNFVLTVIDNHKVYESNVTESILKSLANKYEVAFNKYLNQIRNSLCNTDIKNIIFNRDGEKFTIKRKEGSISIQFADFTLIETNFNTAVIKLLDTITESNEFYRNTAVRLQRESEIALEEKNLYVQKLEDFANKKKDMERDMYSKFLMILNQKKRHLQTMQEFSRNYVQNDNDNELNGNSSRQEMISESDTETSVAEPAEIGIHNAQRDTNEETRNMKRISEAEEHGIGIKSLPKRVKLSDNPGPSKVTTEENDITNDNNEVDSKEGVKSPEIAAEKEEEDSQDLNFNTQDLFDRL